MKTFLPLTRLIVGTILLPMLLAGQAWTQTIWYSTGSNSSPHVLTSWRANRNNTGANPTSFTADNQVFLVQDGHTVSSGTVFTISGAGSRLEVEGGGIWSASVNNTMSVRLAGTPTKLAIWRQAGTYGNTIPETGGNRFARFELANATFFRYGQSYTGSVYLSSPAAITVNQFAANLNIGGDFVINQNVTHQGTFESTPTHTIGGSVIVRGGVLNMTTSFGAATWNIGGSLINEGSGIINQGPGTGQSTINLGTAAGDDTLDIDGRTLIANINFTGGQRTVITSNLTVNSGTINTGSGANTVLELGSSVISGSALLTIPSADVTLVTSHPAGFSNTARTDGNLQTTGTRSIATGINYTVTGNATTLLGLGGLSSNIGNLTIASTTTVFNNENVAVSGTYTVAAGATNSIVDRSLQLFGPINISGGLLGSTGSFLTISGSGSITGTIPLGSVCNLTLNRAGTIPWGANLTVECGYTVATGCTHDISGRALTLNGSINVSGAVTTDANTDLTIQNSNTFNWPSFAITTVRNFTFTRAMTLYHGSDLVVNGTYTVGTGVNHVFSNRSLTLNGPVAISGQLIPDGGSFSFHLGGTGAIVGLPNMTTFNNFSLTRPGTRKFGTGTITVAGTYTLGAGATHDITGQTLTLNGPANVAGVLLTNASSSLNLNGSGAVTGGFSFTELNSLGISRAMTFVLQSNAVISGLSLGASSILDLSNRSLTINGAMTLTSGNQIIGNSATNLTISGTGTITGVLNMTQCNNLTLTRAATLLQVSSLQVHGTYTIGAGATHNIQTRSVTFSGPVLNSGTMSINSATSITLNGTGAVSGLSSFTSINNFIIERPITIVHNANLVVSGTYNIGTGAVHDISGRSVTFNGPINITGTVVTSPTTSVNIAGSGAISGTTTFSPVLNFTLSRSSTFKQSIVVHGSYVIGSVGVHDASNASLTFNGVVNINLTGSLITNDSTDLTIQGTGLANRIERISRLRNFSLNRAVTFTPPGNLVVNGTFNLAGGATYAIAANTSLTIMRSVTISSDATLTGSSGDLNIIGTGTITGSLGLANIRNLTLTRADTLTHNNFMFVYGNFTIGPNATYDARGKQISFGSNIDIQGRLLTNAASSIYIDNTSGSFSSLPKFTELNNFAFRRPSTYMLDTNFTVNGIFTLANTSAINFRGRQLTLKGQIAASGGFITDEASSLVIDGTGTISNVPMMIKIKDFTLARAGTTWLFNNLLTISGSLTFAGGMLNSGTGKVILASGASISGESNTSHLIGELEVSRSVGTGGSNFGGAGFVLGAGADNLGTVTLLRNTSIAYSVSNSQSISTRFSIAITGSQPVAGRSISLSWLAARDNGNDFTVNQADLWRRNNASSPWSRIGTGLTVSRSGDWRTIAGTTNHFSDFAVFAPGVLPVDWLSIKAVRKQSQVMLDWQTAAEKNNKGFVIERSFDGEQFQAIGFVNGVGTTSQTQSYTWYDHDQSKAAYYRVRQQDFDGHESLSPTVFVTATNHENLKPNLKLVNGQLLADQTLEAELIILEAAGRKVHSQQLSGQSDVSWPQHLGYGVYQLMLNNHDGQVWTYKLVSH